MVYYDLGIREFQLAEVLRFEIVCDRMSYAFVCTYPPLAHRYPALSRYIPRQVQEVRCSQGFPRRGTALQIPFVSKANQTTSRRGSEIDCTPVCDMYFLVRVI